MVFSSESTEKRNPFSFTDFINENEQEIIDDDQDDEDDNDNFVDPTNDSDNADDDFAPRNLLFSFM